MWHNGSVISYNCNHQWCKARSQLPNWRVYAQLTIKPKIISLDASCNPIHVCFGTLIGPNKLQLIAYRGWGNIDGLMQERRYSITNTLESLLHQAIDIGYLAKLNFNSNLTESSSAHHNYLIWEVKSVWNCVQNPAMSLSYPAQIPKNIGQLRKNFWAKPMSQYLRISYMATFSYWPFPLIKMVSNISNTDCWTTSYKACVVSDSVCTEYTLNIIYSSDAT